MAGPTVCFGLKRFTLKLTNDRFTWLKSQLAAQNQAKMAAQPVRGGLVRKDSPQMIWPSSGLGRLLVVLVATGLALVGCSPGGADGQGGPASAITTGPSLDQPQEATSSPATQGDSTLPSACSGMAQVPRVEGAGEEINQTLEQVAHLIDAATCQGESTEPDQVIEVRVLPQDGDQLTYVWQGVVQASQVAYPGIALTCVTVDLKTGQILVPGRALANDPARMEAIEQLVFEGVPVGELAQLVSIGDELSHLDQWSSQAPSVPNCLWSGQTLVLVPVIHALGEWLPILVNDWQADLMPLTELTGQ